VNDLTRTLLLIVLVLSLTSCRGADAPPSPAERTAIRQELFAELQPVKLADCEFTRVGEATDGGYVMCKNLIARSQAIYSYGINGEDNWGCSVSRMTALPVHQYDCFNLKRPSCEGAKPVFHEECVGPSRVTEEGRLFDTVEAQIAKNGDSGKRVVMKMDVEGAEWPSFLAMPEAVLQQIDQLSVEFHRVDDPSYVEVIRKLKKTFHLVNVHYNNWTCDAAAAPLPAWAYEVLFVNKNAATVDPQGAAPVPNPFDGPNNFHAPDCQALPAATESKSPR
jgi:hypothetical protein